jgi:hypothetical protein
MNTVDAIKADNAKYSAFAAKLNAELASLETTISAVNAIRPSVEAMNAETVRPAARR